MPLVRIEPIEHEDGGASEIWEEAAKYRTFHPVSGDGRWAYLNTMTQASRRKNGNIQGQRWSAG